MIKVTYHRLLNGKEKHYEGQSNLKPVKDYLYYDLKSHILAAVG
ncbi:MAG: hypothetical protein ACTSRI_07955 [Promethearchaeota archaeon]